MKKLLILSLCWASQILPAQDSSLIEKSANKTSITLEVFGAGFWGGLGVQHQLNPRWALSASGIALPLKDNFIANLKTGVIYTHPKKTRIFPSLEFGFAYIVNDSYNARIGEFGTNGESIILQTGRRERVLTAYLQPAINFRLSERLVIALEYTRFHKIYAWDDWLKYTPWRDCGPRIFGGLANYGGLKFIYAI